MKFSILKGQDGSDPGQSAKVSTKGRINAKTPSPLRDSESQALDSFHTEMTTNASNGFRLADQIQFVHAATLPELKSQTLCVELFTKEGAGAEPIAQYLVNMFIVAIGPVHHGVELTATQKGAFGMMKKVHVGRLDMDLEFTQRQKVEI